MSYAPDDTYMPTGAYKNISTATTTIVKPGAGVLHTLTVNTTAAGAITIYDNTAASGTKIATLKASIAEQTFTFDVGFGTGLTIVTAAASDITVSFA
jgi:hypothetical protein